MGRAIGFLAPASATLSSESALANGTALNATAASAMLLLLTQRRAP